MPTDPDEFLMGGGGRSATFEVGDRYEGEILSKSVRQQTDFTTKKPMFWDDSRPREQMIVALQTDLDEPDEDGNADDGVRNLYVRFKMKDAVAKAVREAGEKKLEIGGWLAVECVGVEKPKKRGAQGAKLYEAEYEAPSEEFFADAEGANEDKDEANAEPEPPARARRAPAKAAARSSSRRAEAEAEAPRRRAAKKAPARAAAGRSGRASRTAAYEDAEDDAGF